MALFGAINTGTDFRSISVVTQYATPASAATVTVDTSGNVVLFLNPAATIALLTVAMPASPSDGDRVRIGCSQIVTALTMTGGTIIGPLTAMAVGGFATFAYSSSATKWFRIG